MRCGGGGGLSHVQITPTWWRLTLAAALLLQRHGARGWRLLIMAFSTLGIVYGDIGGSASAAAVCARRRCCKARCPTTASWSLAPGPCSLAGTLPRQHSCLSPPLLPLPLILAATSCVSLQAPRPSMFSPPSSPTALPPTATSCWVLPPPSFGASPPLVGAPAWVLASRVGGCAGGWAGVTTWLAPPCLVGPGAWGQPPSTWQTVRLAGSRCCSFSAASHRRDTAQRPLASCTCTRLAVSSAGWHHSVILLLPAEHASSVTWLPPTFHPPTIFRACSAGQVRAVHPVCKRQWPG